MPQHYNKSSPTIAVGLDSSFIDPTSPYGTHQPARADPDPWRGLLVGDLHRRSATNACLLQAGGTRARCAHRVAGVLAANRIGLDVYLSTVLLCEGGWYSGSHTGGAIVRSWGVRAADEPDDKGLRRMIPIGWT
jgi:hypothetical protein